MAGARPHHDACGCGCDGDHGAACRVLAAAAPLPTVDPTAWEVRRRRAVRRAAGVRDADPSSARRVHVLMLDVGGVVIPSLFESVVLPGFPAGPLAGEAAWARVQQGETTERDYWSAIAQERPGLDVAALWRDCSRVRDELRGALDVLARRVRVVAFTNDMAHFFGDDWPRRFPEMAAFDAIVEANRLGVHKPDPAAFRAAAAAIGERPERCLFVDDLDANVAGARRAGMHGLPFDVRDPAGAIAAVLRALEIPCGEPPQPQRAFRAAPVRPASARAFAARGGVAPSSSTGSWRSPR